MRPFVKRYINVAVDGLLQATVVAAAGLLMTGALVVFGHLRGPWSDRILGVMVGLIFVPLCVLILKLVRLRMGRAGALLELPKGFLDYKWDVENAMAELAVILNRLAEIMAQVGPTFDRHALSLHRVTGASASQQLKVSKAASLSLDRYSARVERVRAKYEAAGELLSYGLCGWFKWIEESRISRESMGTFPEEMKSFSVGLNGSNEMLCVYISAMESGRGASRIMDAAIDRHLRPLRTIFDTNVKIQAACSESLRVFDGLA